MIIAEIGINHEGNVKTALKMIKAAKASGANAVKFQKRNPDICVPEAEKTKIVNYKGKNIEYIKLKRQLELSTDDYNKIDSYCKKIDMLWFASVFDIDSLNFISDFSTTRFIKLPSSQLRNTELLKAVKKTAIKKNIHVFMSTGGSKFVDILTAKEILGDTLSVIFHTTSIYPCPNDKLNLVKIATLKDLSDYKTVGYSNHHKTALPAIFAKEQGASHFEFHVTLDKSADGCDHNFSIDFNELKTIIDILKTSQKWLGDSIFEPDILEQTKLKKQIYFEKS